MTSGAGRRVIPLVDLMYLGIDSDNEHTLAEAVAEFKRRVVKATIESHPTNGAAARSLGITREGLWKLRKRHGIHVPSQTKAVPDDWRERLDAASPQSEERRTG